MGAAVAARLSVGSGLTTGVRLGPQIAPRLALLVVGAVFGGFCLTVLLDLAAEGPSLGRTAPALVCLALLLYLQLQVFSDPVAQPRTPRGDATFLAQACLAYLPSLYFGQVWLGMLGFLAGTALLVMPSATAWPSFVGIAVSGGVLQASLTGAPLDIAYLTMFTALTGLIVYGLSRLRSLATGLTAGRSALADLAVIQERLRFARDLHDLLGFSLCAITLKTELAHRLVTKRPERAQVELAEVLDISRQALADVSSVASSYRELSLDEEVALARSVLAAAEIAVTMRLDHGELPPDIRTALATILREGVTNLLRHSKAENCEINIARTGDVVSVAIINDGVPDLESDPEDTTGSGTRNLARRVEELGGTLTAWTTADHTYRLHAQMPMPAPSMSEPGAADLEPTRGEVHDEHAMEPRLAMLIVVAVFTAYGVNSLLRTWDLGLGAAGFALCVGCVAAAVALQFGLLSRRAASLRFPLHHSALLAMAVVVYLPIVLFGQPALGLPGFLAGSSLLVLPPRVGAAAFAGVVASTGLLHGLYGGSPVAVAGGIVATATSGLVVYGLSRLRSLVTGLHAARSELADLAVAKERLRFATDLHDLLGFSLSTITLKSVLTHRLVARQPDRAQTELSELLVVSRQALADIRAVASSYRELSLEDETATARALLVAADVAVTVRLDDGELPDDVRTALAGVLREGVTNLLRHSDAHHCEITFVHTTETAAITIVNDGVPATSDTGRGGGIQNLANRVAFLGGQVTAGATDDLRYRLHAEVPLR
jgi:signal transduction histidine kinase